MTSAYGDYGVMWGGSPQYYTPEAPVHGSKLYSKYLKCNVVFWLDVGKHIDAPVSAHPERFLLASVHRDSSGVGKTCNVQVAVKDAAHANHEADIGGVSSLRAPTSIGHGMFVAPLADVVVAPDCKVHLVRFWSHTNSSCSGSTEAFVLVPLGRAAAMPAKPVQVTAVAESTGAVRKLTSFLTPFTH